MQRENAAPNNHQCHQQDAKINIGLMLDAIGVFPVVTGSPSTGNVPADDTGQNSHNERERCPKVILHSSTPRDIRRALDAQRRHVVFVVQAQAVEKGGVHRVQYVACRLPQVRVLG